MRKVSASAGRWLLALAASAALLALVLYLAGRLHRQVLPFYVLGHAFFIVIKKVLIRSVEAGVEQLQRSP